MYIEAAALSQQSQETWDGYRAWNRIISDYFYTGRFSGRSVYLDINDQLLIELGGNLKTKDPIANFKRSIKFTLAAKNLFLPHLKIAEAWRNRKTEETPPFIGLLAFFSYVAEKMVRDKEYAAHNYYGRLKRELDLLNYDSQSLQKSYRDISIFLWPLLNDWIDKWGGELGIPTARALDNRKYVSTAISQALVREQDRNLLMKLFADQGLAPGQRLKNTEMLGLLLNWVSSLATQNSLSRLLLREGEVRDKVVEIACAELEMWDGRIEEHNEFGEKISFLYYLAAFKDYPSPKLTLFLSSNVSQDVSKNLIFSKSTENHQFVFECPISEVRLEWLQDFGVSTLEPYEKISQGDALLSRMLLETSDGKRRFTRNGQPLCIMNYRTDIGAFQEAARISLGQRSLILVHSSVKDQIASMLEETARPGYSIYDSNSCKGVPDKWFLFSNVQIIKVVHRDGLDALVPLQDNAINLSGGLSLGYDTWLTSAPPEVTITVKNPAPVNIEIKQILSFNRLFPPLKIHSSENFLPIELEKYHLADGDYEINVLTSNDNDENTRSVVFKLRSSNCIRIYKTSDYERLSHIFGDEEILGAITATRNVSREPGKAYLSGLSISSDREIDIDYSSVEISEVIPSHGDIQDDEYARVPLLTTKIKETNSCIFRGNHIIKFPGIPSGVAAGYSVAGKCTDCGLTFWKYSQREKSSSGRTFQIRNIEPKNQNLDSLPNILPKKIDQSRIQLKSDAQTRSSGTSSIDSRNISSKLDLKDIFDALCYLKEGRFEKFCNLVRNLSPDLWYPHELIRQLSALGHIDVEYDLSSLKPKYWRIADPSIIDIGKKEFIISGWQSENFIELVKAVSKHLDAEIIIENDGSSLPVIKILNIDISDMETFASIVSEESDYPLKSEKHFGEKALTLMPTLSLLMDSLETVEMPSQNLEFFDPQTRHWRRVTGEIISGGYRHREFGIKYYYLKSENILSRKASICDARLVKYFSLRENLHHLISFNHKNLELITPFGMDLPFLYERIAVSYSGHLPTKEGGLVKYKNIPSDVAGGLLFKLSN